LVIVATYDIVVPAGAVAGLNPIEPCMPSYDTTVPGGQGEPGIVVGVVVAGAAPAGGSTVIACATNRGRASVVVVEGGCVVGTGRDVVVR
jgi:hypothetical protein